MSDIVLASLASHGRATPQGPPTVAPAGWDPSHITFGDVLSALNPLQYLPVVGMIYREVTGDEVHPALRVAVAAATTVLLGPIGLAAAMIGVAVDEVRHGRPAGAGQGAAVASAYRRAARLA
jgi:hypothetical protein